MNMTVEFVGICTHIRELASQEENAPPRHRVVLVNAQNGARINGHAIPPHTATLIIDPAQIRSIEGYPYGLEETERPGVWRLAGVTLAIEGAEDAYERLESFGKLPRMRSESKGLAPARNVVEDGEAACYFDIKAGHLESVQDAEDQPISTMLTVNTTDAPALRVTCFWNDQTSRIHLQPGAKIVVEHTGHLHGDSDMDYLLHYRVFGVEVPKDAFIPKKPRRHTNKPPNSISVACSNSQYP